MSKSTDIDDDTTPAHPAQSPEHWPDLPDIIAKLVELGLVVIDDECGTRRLTDDGQTALARNELIERLCGPTSH